MTTDDAQARTGTAADPSAAQARIEALRQRRATSGAHRDSEAARPRRRHAAAGARILAAGLSASAALGLMGAMAGGLSSDSATDPAADAGGGSGRRTGCHRQPAFSQRH